MKKFILPLLILFVFALGLISGLAVGKNKFIEQQKQQEAIVSLTPSASPSTMAVEMTAATTTKHFFVISEEYKKAFASKENYRAGLAETFKDIPLSSGVKPSDVWTVLKPHPSIVYFVAAPRAEVVSFYEEKLKASGWLENNYDEYGDEGNIITRLAFNQPNSGKILVLFIDDKPPSSFPQELGREEQTYVNFYLFFAVN